MPLTWSLEKPKVNNKKRRIINKLKTNKLNKYIPDADHLECRGGGGEVTTLTLVDVLL